MFNNMKIGMRLALGFCVVIGFLIAIILVSLNQMAASQDKLKIIVNITTVRVQLANNMIDNAREVALAVRGILLLKYNKESSENIQKMKDEWAEKWRIYYQNIAEVKKLIIQEDTTGSVLLGKIEAAADSARSLTAKAIDLAVAGKVKDATDFVFGTAYPSVKRWIQYNQDFIKHNEERTAFRYSEAI